MTQAKKALLIALIVLCATGALFYQVFGEYRLQRLFTFLFN